MGSRGTGARLGFWRWRDCDQSRWQQTASAAEKPICCGPVGRSSPNYSVLPVQECGGLIDDAAEPWDLLAKVNATRARSRLVALFGDPAESGECRGYPAPVRGGDRLAALIKAAVTRDLVDRGELVARGFEGLAGPEKQNPRPVAAERGCFSHLPPTGRARTVKRRNARTGRPCCVAARQGRPPACRLNLRFALRLTGRRLPAFT